MAWQYAIAQTVSVTFYKSGVPTAPTGALTATISKGGASFGALAGSVVQVAGTPVALLSLAIADTTCAAGVVKIVDAGGAVDDRYVEFTTEANYTADLALVLDKSLPVPVSSIVVGPPGSTAPAQGHGVDSFCLSGDQSDLDGRAIQWLTGDNAGTFQIIGSADYYPTDNDTVITATPMMAHIVVVGDTFYSYPRLSVLQGQDVRDAMAEPLSEGYAVGADSIDDKLGDVALEATLTAIKGAGWVDENLVEIQAAAEVASGAVGTGAKSVTIQVNDGAGNAVPNVRVTIKNTGQTADIGIQTTGATGATPSGFGLDPSTGYKAVLSGLSASYTYANPYTVTTAAGTGAQTVTLVVTAVTIPAPVSTANYLLYGYARKLEADAAFGAAGMVVQVVSVSSAGQVDATANATRAIMGTSYSTDSTGLWSFELAKALAGQRLKLKFAWTDSSSVSQDETWEAEILAAQANGSDQIAWADLSPAKR